jgi:hypothetical protein
MRNHKDQHISHFDRLMLKHSRDLKGTRTAYIYHTDFLYGQVNMYIWVYDFELNILH